MSAWYIETWVNAPLAGDVTDRPHPVGALHPEMVVDRQRRGRLVEAEGGHVEPGQIGAAPGGHQQPVGHHRLAPSRVRANRRPSWPTDSMVAPVRTPMPSDRNTSANSSPDSGSSGPTRWGPASSTVTREPKRWNTWASSTPMAPPPMTASESGTSSVSMASRLVQ